MSNTHSPKPQSQSPRFLVRIHARQAPRTPQWLNWNAAVLVCAAIGFGWVLTLLSPILAPFLAAAILAYIFDPLVSALERKGIARTFGTVIAVLAMLLIVALLMVIVLPLFAKEIAQLTAELPNLAEQIKTRAVPWINQQFGLSLSLDASSFREFVTENMSDASGLAKRVFSSVGVGGLALVGFLINVLLIPVVLFYVLRDWPLLVRQVDGLIPRAMHPTVSTIAREVDAVLSEFLRGQLSVMVIMAIFYVVGLWLVGLHFALPVGLITGLLVFVPYLGSGTGLVLGTIAALLQNPSLVPWVWAVFGAGQLIEGFAVTPWLVGDRIGLHPVAVMFALLAFGQIFGFFGVLLALPVSAAILVGLRHLGAGYRASTLYSR